MAILTRKVNGAVWPEIDGVPGGECWVEVDFDDAFDPDRAVTARATNTSPVAGLVRVTNKRNAEVFTVSVAARVNLTTPTVIEQALPQNAARRIEITPRGTVRIDGFSCEILLPAP